MHRPGRRRPVMKGRPERDQGDIQLRERNRRAYFSDVGGRSAAMGWAERDDVLAQPCLLRSHFLLDSTREGHIALVKGRRPDGVLILLHPAPEYRVGE